MNAFAALPETPPADWTSARFYRAETDDCAVLEDLGGGRGRIVAHPTDGPRKVLFSGTYGEAYEAWLALRAVS